MYRAPIAQRLRGLTRHADGAWYSDISHYGYDRGPFTSEAGRQHNWAFFPLWPLLMRLAVVLTGEPQLGAMVLSNIFLLFALILLHKTALAFGLDKEAADRAIFYIATFPTSHFFSVAMTESLFLFLTVGSFYAAKRGRWWMAGSFGALASATRFAGVFLLPALLVLYWQEHRKQRPQADVFALLLIPLGLIAFMIYLHTITGNALAFMNVQQAWGRGTGFFLRPLWEYLMDPWLVSISWNFKLLNFLCGPAGLKLRDSAG